MNTTIQHQLIHWDMASNKAKDKDLLREEPLSIRVEGNPYSVMMRTPGGVFLTQKDPLRAAEYHGFPEGQASVFPGRRSQGPVRDKGLPQKVA